ncbi:MULTISPECIES: hypothetical protein [Hafnia]|nr:hypothetical protein [Hafnia paralvei]NIH30825.1 hypothetical protein [Hafnia paralvei]
MQKYTGVSQANIAVNPRPRPLKAHLILTPFLFSETALYFIPRIKSHEL